MIKLDHINHNYGAVDNAPVIADISFEITPGECVGLTGPSGCGKSTLAQIIAGHIKPVSGKIFVDGEDRTFLPGRKVFMIHQEPDLFPWQRVIKQVLFAMEKKNQDKAAELLSLVKLEGCANLFPNQLSGGMKKRLALARALAINPSLLILDESFSSLDSTLKKELYNDLKLVWKKTGTTILLITHDSSDLENLAHREIRLTSEKPTSIHQIVNYYD
ncbi:MAG: ABC transporter ATP-binding protein [Proteobacteria bacterium]|nr:ABC transporter ATP-binding protein [Pseudomonadota bacterium]MBU1738347.1 ABC transporter ATP-binding protein [Pseudomonadota bacterium]